MSTALTGALFSDVLRNRFLVRQTFAASYRKRFPSACRLLLSRHRLLARKRPSIHVATAAKQQTVRSSLLQALALGRLDSRSVLWDHIMSSTCQLCLNLKNVRECPGVLHHAIDYLWRLPGTDSWQRPRAASALHHQSSFGLNKNSSEVRKLNYTQLPTITRFTHSSVVYFGRLGKLVEQIFEQLLNTCCLWPASATHAYARPAEWRSRCNGEPRSVDHHPRSPLQVHVSWSVQVQKERMHGKSNCRSWIRKAWSSSTKAGAGYYKNV